MKKYIFSIIVPFFLLIISLSFFVRISSAQETPEVKAKKFGVAFPVSELGNCTSVLECHTYCEDQTHRDACVAFAKKKGFYKEKEIDPKRQTMIQAAKTELGCTSEESCKSICQQEANFEKCRTFAEKNGLDSGQKNPGDKKILEKAKEILGCDSPTSCKAVCEQEANRDKCSEFAKQTGLEGGKRRVGPGGCNSEESCKAYCEKNSDECKKFGGGPSSDDKKRIGPGGCNSEESCKAYCNEHPDECKNENEGPGKNDGSGSDDKRINQKGPGGCDSEESCKKYCVEHPNECGAGNKQNPEGLRRNVTGGPSEDFCKTNPDECRKKESEIQDRQFKINQETEKERRQFQPIERKVEDRDGPPEIRREKEDENRPPEEVRGASTEITFFDKIMDFLLGK